MNNENWCDRVENKGRTMKKTLIDRYLKLNDAELQSNHHRVKWAEGLILQLPKEHDGRNSWLLNYGICKESVALRKKLNLLFDDGTQSAQTIKS